MKNFLFLTFAFIVLALPNYPGSDTPDGPTQSQIAAATLSLPHNVAVLADAASVMTEYDYVTNPVHPLQVAVLAENDFSTNEAPAVRLCDSPRILTRSHSIHPSDINIRPPNLPDLQHA